MNKPYKFKGIGGTIPPIIQPEEIIKNYTYFPPFSRRVPIIASQPISPLKKWIVTNESTGEEDYKEDVVIPFHQDYLKLIECGFDMAILTSGYGINRVNIALNNIENLNFKVVLGTPLYTNRNLGISYGKTLPVTDPKFDYLRNYISTYARNEKVAGFIVYDEPKYYNWNIIKDEELNKILSSDKIADIVNLRMYYNYIISFLQVENLRDSFAPLVYDKNVYFSLAPSDSIENIGETNDSKSAPLRYQSYLEELNSVFHPSMWSIDIYPILSRKYPNPSSKFNGTYQLYSSNNFFYSYLKDMKDACDKIKRPFWYFLCCMEYLSAKKLIKIKYTDGSEIVKIDSNESGYSRPAVTEGMLRFQAFSALAYGAQGIYYWTYGIHNNFFWWKKESLSEFGLKQVKERLEKTYPELPSTDLIESIEYGTLKGSEESGEYYISALVDFNNNKFPAWDFAKTINAEIRKWDFVFYNCQVLDIIHIGIGRDTIEGYLKDGISPELTRDGNLVYDNTEIQPIGHYQQETIDYNGIESISYNGHGVMISHLKKSNTEYLVIVSHDPFHEQEITLYYSKGDDHTNPNIPPIQIEDEDQPILPPYRSSTYEQTIVLKEGGFVVLQIP